VTGLTEAAMQILVMNMAHLLRFPLGLFLRVQARWIRKEEIPLAVGFQFK
jgi:hypothetical protein